MPLYEYECTACHRHTEKIQKFSDPEITTCPHCRGELKRVISAPAFALKGGGWYADGYGNAKPAGAGDKGGAKDGTTAPAADAGKADAGKTDAGKTAAPAAAAPAAAPSAPAPAPASALGGDKK